LWPLCIASGYVKVATLLKKIRNEKSLRSWPLNGLRPRLGCDTDKKIRNRSLIGVKMRKVRGLWPLCIASGYVMVATLLEK
jgi:hypothetical protein